RLGSFGPEVRDAKRRLADKTGGDMTALGDNLLFGLAFRRALERFQSEEGLPPSGELDEVTRRHLFH
ncbi:MAG: peptidoglycan-binding protein, partial [Clostridia bacterium]|nr:peptidoglycan-binding protein [Clostridia bacterium]